MGTVVASLIVKVLSEVDGAIQGLNKVDKAVSNTAAKMKKVGASMASIGKSLTLRATTPLLALGAVAVNAASDLAESMSAVGTVFGDAAKDVSGFSGSVAKDLGLSRQEALQAATTFGAMGRQIGLTGKDLSSFSNSSLQAAADLASFYNAPVPEALAAIQSGLQGEAEPLRRFGIFLSDATLNAYAMAKGIGKTTQEMSEQEKIALRQQYIMENLGAAQGDFSRTSGGLANQTRILKAELMDIAAQIGTVLLPYSLQVVGIFREWAQRFADLSPRTQKIIVVVAGLVAVLGPLLVVLGTAVTAISALGPALAILTGPVGLVIGALVLLGIAYKTNFLGFADAVNWVAKTVRAKLQPVIRAIRLFVEGLRKLGKDTERVHKILNALPAPLSKLLLIFARVKQGVDRFIKAWKEAGALAAFRTIPRSIELLGRTIGNFFQSIGFNRFGQQFKAVFKEIGDVIGAVVDLVADIVHGRWSQVWDGLVNLATQAAELLIAAIKAQLALIGDLFGAAIDAIRGVDWGSVASWLADQGLRLVTGLYEAAAGFWDGTVQPWLEDLPSRIADAVPELVGTLAAKGRDLLTGLYRAALGILTGTVLPWLRGLADDILGAMPDLLGTLAGHGTDLLQGMWDGVLAVWDARNKFADFFSRIGSKIAGLIPDDIGTRLLHTGEKILGGLWDGISAVWEDPVKKWFGDLGRNVVDAAPNIADTLSTLYGHGKALIGGLLSGIKEVWKKVTDFFGGLGSTIKSVIDAISWDSVFGALTTALGVVEDTITRVADAIKGIKGWFGGGGSDTGGQPATGEPAQTGGTASAMTVAFDPGTSLADIEAWATSVAAALTPLAAYLIFSSGSGGGATTSMSLQAPPFKGQGTLQTIERFAKDVIAEFKRINLASAEQMRALKANVDIQLGQLKTSATTRTAQTRAAMTNEWIGARSDATTIFGTLRTSVANALVGMRNDAVQLATSLKTGVVNQFSSMQARAGGAGEGETNVLKVSVRNAFNAMRDESVSRAGDLRSGVVAQFVNLRLGVVAAMGGIRDAVSSGISRARDAAYNAASGFYGVGYAMGQGINNGLAAWISSIAATAVASVNNAINQAKKAAQVASPSRKTRWIGEMMGQGLAVGWRDSLGDIRRASSDAVNASFAPWSGPALSPSVAGGGGAVSPSSIAGSSRGGDSYAFDIDIVVEGAGDPEATGDAIVNRLVREFNVKGKPKGFR